MEAIFFIRQSMKRYIQKRQDLHMEFIDQDKAYDKVVKRVFGGFLRRKKCQQSMLALIKDMYDRETTCVKTREGKSSDFPITIGSHLRIDIKS